MIEIAPRIREVWRAQWDAAGADLLLRMRFVSTADSRVVADALQAAVDEVASEF